MRRPDKLQNSSSAHGMRRELSLSKRIFDKLTSIFRTFIKVLKMR